jgi:hypothetical protein
MKSTRWLIFPLGALLLASCARERSDETKELTERQRDSVIARSSLPGADVVGRAMAESDRASHQAAKIDAKVDSLTR